MFPIKGKRFSLRTEFIGGCVETNLASVASLENKRRARKGGICSVRLFIVENAKLNKVISFLTTRQNRMHVENFCRFP